MAFKVTAFALIVAIVYGGIKFNRLFQNAPVPNLDEPYWGPGSPKADSRAVVPFKIDVDDEVLIDLKNRLANHRKITQSLEGANQDYGIHSNHLEEILNYWEKDYKWKEREVILNKFPQFKTEIQGLKIHYIHVKPADKNVKTLPLLILHGWPGSVKEFHRILPMLTQKQEGADFAFEVIAASLPGYGFSQAPSKMGLGAMEMAVIFKNLMIRLGFDSFYVQGGDWGGVIVTHMATLYPRHVRGMHSNMCFVNTPLSFFKHTAGSFCPSLFMTEKEVEKNYPLSKYFYNLMLEFGYMHLQSTKPDTLGVGLTDSPAGLAAYILEKFSTWTNPHWKDLPDAGLNKKYNYDDLLDNVMIYWVTKTITTSMRLYSESFNILQSQSGIARAPITVPAACARYQYELGIQPEWILKDKYTNLVQLTDYDFGGHFIAFEEPTSLTKDIFTAVMKMEQSNSSK
ncbi:PREDICTED: juvenile hormone epoxide hydrolase 1-like [Nicrophorus vespilloides]|uniref:Epoxide hydrolase n=1 Tax=Nicrophorus vespilloides TaxID=110193 RepID=A0ABM1MKP8_NICVS|nr:PREDICTED: juvenile hormone epoxide hydrolase 1-like [Nicrophorus vespilloides]